MSEKLSHPNKQSKSVSETPWDELKNVAFAIESLQATLEASPTRPSREQSRNNKPSTPASNSLAEQGLQKTGTQLKPVEQLSDQDAAREYLDLLADLSSGFTSPEGRTGRAVVKNRDGTETIMGNNGYFGGSKFAQPLFKRAEVDNPAYLDRARSLELADNILKAESVWRQGGEMFDQAQYDSAKQALADFQAKDSKKFFLTKLFTRKKRQQERTRLEQNVADLNLGKRMSEEGNAMLASALSYAYDADYHHGHHRENYGITVTEKAARNAKYNDLFFSAENQAKIDRALALRTKLYPPKKFNGQDQHAGLRTYLKR